MTTSLAILCACLPLCALAEQGLASWYGEDHRGKIMANGKPFDPNRLTCASWSYPLGTRLRITHGTRSVVVTVTDRGPNKRFKARVIDLSAAAFGRLHARRDGLVHVEVTRI